MARSGKEKKENEGANETKKGCRDEVGMETEHKRKKGVLFPSSSLFSSSRFLFICFQVYEWMQLRVEDASFLKCLEESRGWSVLSTKSKEEALNAPALKEVEEELLDKKQQSEDDDDENSSRANGEEAEGLSEGWELVEKEEVLDAMAMFIAAYIQAHPQASKLTPVEIQKALSVAFKELRKSKVVLLWEWSSTIWRAGAMSYGAFSLYTQPWIVRAALQAMWCGSKLVIGATATAIGLL
mmetsp:Transcript_8163/g.15129  ORF Transcript_8163/g.15129 Transcript_8163/m.15129 type:complete len:240 (+) Transcript_8163:674-1393(+)